MSNALMIQAIGELRTNCATAYAAVSGAMTVTAFGYELVGSSTSKDATLKALTVAQGRIEDLDRRRELVLTGELTAPRWFSLAEDIHNEIRQHHSEIGGWSMAGVLSSTYSATSGDVKRLAQEAVDETRFPLAAVALIVVGLVLLRVV